jgi:hypothetical protein
LSLPRPRPPRPRKPPNCAPPGAGVVLPDCVGLHPTDWSEPRPRSAGRRGSNRSCSTGCDAAGSLITARPATGASVCLGCRLPSERVDGRYRRHVLDLPVAGRPVRLLAIARRFHCDTCCAGDRFHRSPSAGRWCVEVGRYAAAPSGGCRVTRTGTGLAARIMRLSTWSARAASARWPGKPRARSLGPTRRLYLPTAVSPRDLRPHPAAFCQAIRPFSAMSSSQPDSAPSGYGGDGRRGA